ncbi:MAG: SIMPL domain-containing protein [Bacteroidales bacterium]|nr:SIMPL domain-containing protein [Bacteroidales bacterium]
MKRIYLAAFMVLAYVTAFAQTGEKNFIDQNYIEVTGKAQMEVAPNEIYLKILVNEKDFKGKQDLQKIEERMIKKLSDMGIDVSKQLAIKDLSSNFQKYWLKRTEINSSKEYQLKVKSAATAGAVIQELNSIGISDISVEKVENTDIQKYRMEVKVMAIKAAKEKAIALTSAIGQKIGKAIYIREIENPVFNVYQAKGYTNMLIRGASSTGDSKPQEPDIEFEKTKLQYSVLVRFILE